MLTKDLLQVTKQAPKIQPQYRDIDEYQVIAEQVLEEYELGKTRGQISKRVSELETHKTFKLVRGLSELLDRRAAFEQQYSIEPVQLREALSNGDSSPLPRNDSTFSVTSEMSSI